MPAVPALDLAFSLKDAQVAAYWPVGQAVSGTLRLEQPERAAGDVGAQRPHQPRQDRSQGESARGDGACRRRGRAGDTDPPYDLAVGAYPVTWLARAADGGQVTASITLTRMPMRSRSAPACLALRTRCSATLTLCPGPGCTDSRPGRRPWPSGGRWCTTATRHPMASVPIWQTAGVVDGEAGRGRGGSVAGSLLDPRSDGPASRR